jgi:hypothetical protein
MGNILQGKYTDFTNEDSDYPSVASIKKVGFMPSPRPTIASQSQAIARTQKAEKEKPNHFIMKRFQNIKSKFEQERDQQAVKSASSQKHREVLEMLRQEDEIMNSGEPEYE